MAEALLMLAGGAAAGVFGSLLGLGGGVLIVPLLTLVFGLELRPAVGVSLIAVIVTSSAAAGVYLERNLANLRLGMTLELFTAIGALVGGLVAFLIDERLLALLFAGLLTYVAASMIRAGHAPHPTPPEDESIPGRDEPDPDPSELDAIVDRLSGTGYRIRGLRLGVVGATVAGVLSALLGIGGGIVKVPLMHLAMGVPLRVATATSNLMIGITAASSAVIYVLRDEVDPYVAGPVAIGVFIGASAGSRLGHRVDRRVLRWLFVVVLGYTALQMLVRAVG